MYWPDGVMLLQHALTVALWLSLPLLGAIALAGLAGAYAQGLFGVTDQGSLTGARLLAAVLVLALFGAWMTSLTCGYWGTLWSHAASYLGGGGR